MQPTPAAAVPAQPVRVSAPAPLAEPNFLSASLAHTPPEPEDDEPAEQLSFLRKDDAPSLWRRPLVRVLLWLVLVVLVAALGAQFLLHERDRIVQIQPATRPLLLALCAWNGCSLAPLRQIESVVIDSSSFGRVRGDTYRLGVALRNNAPVDIAMPALELTLTDTQDQALIRRILLPTEFGATSARLAAGADWSTALSLSVKTADNAARITGYRVLAFYP